AVGYLLDDQLKQGFRRGFAHTVMASAQPPPTRGRGLEFAFDATNLAYLDFIEEALQTLDTLYNSPTFLALGGWFSLRFVGQSRAYLSPQHQSTRTCMIEFTGVEGLWSTVPIIQAMEAVGLKHGGIQHWGMFYTLAAPGVERAYPQLKTWRQVRWELTNS